MKKILYIIPALMLAMTTLIAQPYSKIEDADILAEQKKVLAQTYPQLFKDAKIQEVLVIDEKHSMVKHLKNGVYYESVINSDRKDMLLLETAELITPADLPNVVRDAFTNSEYGDEKIINQFKVKRPDGEQLYRIDIKKSGQDYVTSYYYNKLGNIAKPVF